MPNSTRRVLPVVRWLQVGVAAAGLGVAMAAVPAVASADDGADSSVNQPSSRGGASEGTQQSAVRRGSSGRAATGDSSLGPRRGANSTRVSAQTTTVRVKSDTLEVTPSATPAIGAVPAASAATAHVAPAATSVAPTSPLAPKAKVTAAAPASTAPGLGFMASKLRLNLEDVLSGTGKPTVTNPTAVVTGVFNEILRRNPTPTELQNYLTRLKWSGVNAVVAGLYSSQAFRQSAVESYYLELLGRTPTSQELNRGVLRYTLGTPDGFAASIAGSQEFYSSSATGGGTFGSKPTATSYVNLLYRSMLGRYADPDLAPPLIQSIQQGLPIARAANEFVETDAYRSVKVGEIYEVLNQTPSTAEIAAYVNNWMRSGGQSGITQSLLATTANVQRIEAGLVSMPNMVAAAQMQELLLAAYTSTPAGFVKTMNRLLGIDDTSEATAKATKCPESPTCNTALFSLLQSGGMDRGIPNGALTIAKGGFADIATLVPTQNEIDLEKSLYFTLRVPANLTTAFAGGNITPAFGGPIVTSDAGTYIVDGHHRWSAIYLINPYAQLASVDIGYVPNPQVGLKEAQIGTMAQNGFLGQSTGGGYNVYNVDRATFDREINSWIVTGPDEEEVLTIFRENLGIPDSATEAEQLAAIDNYIWTNVERMRALNPFVPGATNREVMPQLDPFDPILGRLGSGMLTYSFPVVSALG